MLRVDSIFKRLGGFELKDVSFEVAEGEYFVLLGASGAGKTVLLEAVTGITTPDGGSVSLGGRDITKEKIQKRDMSLVFQNGALFPHMNVRENVEYGLWGKGLSSGERRSRVEGLARDLGFVGLLDRKPATLSGGEAQRVALARAMAPKPRCLLLDEPLSSLDSGARSGLRAILRNLDRKGMSVVHVTHDYEEALSLADRIGVMEKGTVVQADKPDRIFRYPASGFVADFVGIRNFFSGTLKEEAGGDDGVKLFEAGGASFRVLTEEPEGEGNVIIRSEDVTVSVEPVSTSARNSFEGTVTDIFPVRLGVEVVVDAGFEMAALLTKRSVRELGLERGRKAFISFKASAVEFVRM